MSERNSVNPRFLRRRIKRRNKKKEFVKFHASIDDQTNLTLYHREGGLYLIIKKDLVKYDLTVKASEAPIINQYLRSPDPFESLIADIKILETEIEPLNLAMQTTFGENKEMIIF